MQALKVLVVVMGVLIVAGVAVIVVTIANRASKQAESDIPKGNPTFGDVRLSLPAGGRVVWATVDAGRLVVHVQGAGEAARFEVVDLTTGARLGSVRVAAEAAR